MAYWKDKQDREDAKVFRKLGVISRALNIDSVSMFMVRDHVQSLVEFKRYIDRVRVEYQTNKTDAL